MTDLATSETMAEAVRVAHPAPYLPDLPLRRYTEPDFYRAEIDHVFRRSWLFAGHESELPTPGSFRTLDLPFAPVVLTRAADGVVRAFLNACRHRGAPVVREEEGTARHLVCGYHSWTYELDGRLHKVPDEAGFGCLDHDARALRPVRCEQWGGFLYINLDPDAVPLSEDLAPLISRYSDLIEAPFRLISRTTAEWPCNWKVAVEAFMEGYHITTVHRRSAAGFLNPSECIVDLHPSGHGTMITPYNQAAIEGNAGVLDLFFPPDVARVSGTAPLYMNTVASFGVFPNLITPLDPSGFPMQLFWPTSPTTTRYEMAWYGLDWGDQPRPAGWDIKLATWDALVAEDYEMLGPIQRSLEAAAHSGIPLHRQERRIWHHHAEIDRRIGPAWDIPPELRVADLLAGDVQP